MKKIVEYKLIYVQDKFIHFEKLVCSHIQEWRQPWWATQASQEDETREFVFLQAMVKYEE